MARGLRKETAGLIDAVRRARPLALGPYMGALAVAASCPASLIAEILGLHEQTVARWFLGRSVIPPAQAKGVGQVLLLLSWLHDKNLVLHGTRAERAAQFVAHNAVFKTRAGASNKRLPSA